MPDSLDSLVDSAVETAFEPATGSSPDKGTGVAEPSGTPSEPIKKGAAAVPASGSAPTRTDRTEAPTTAVPASDGKPTSESDELSADEKVKGVPVDRHLRIVQNNREKSETRVYAEEIGYSRDEFKTLKPHVDALATDAVGYYKWLGGHLKSQGLLKDEPTAPVAATAQPTAQAPTEKPLPDLRAEDGTFAYSDKAMERLLAWERAQIFGQFDERLKPFEDTRTELEAQKMSNRADQFAKATIAEAETWEGWKDLRPQIAAMMKADGRHTVQSAYSRLLPEYLKEQRKTLASQTRETTLAEIAAKPKGPGKELRPSAASVGTRGRSNKGRTPDEIMDSALEGVFS